MDYFRGINAHIYFVILLLSACNKEIAVGRAAYRPYVNDPECPMKPELAINRKCEKKCRTDLDCKGPNRKCLCDGVCGKSCVKPTQRCDIPNTIINGNLVITPYNKFGAKMTYTCNDGFVLTGQTVRVCQADEHWSGNPPTCETEGKCGEPPEILHAMHNGQKGQHQFSLGTQLSYECAEGYILDGHFRAMCVGEGRWVGPRMNCSARRCSHPGDIPNGKRHGYMFTYPNHVSYVCNEGYVLDGNQIRYCLANDSWSGHLPRCRPVKCDALHRPTNGDLHGTDITYKAVMTFSCKRGYKLIGSEKRTCEQNGKWTGMDVYCQLVDCGDPGYLSNGNISDGTIDFNGKLKTTFGTRLSFSCYPNITHDGASEAVCEESGNWSNPIPKCFRACRLPFIENGFVVKNDMGENDLTRYYKDYASHGHNITVFCEKKYQVQKANVGAEPLCNNGTWEYLPRCVEASCTARPKELREGIVRVYRNEHGAKAKYECNTGYTLVGDKYVHCIKGEWNGSTPICRQEYCQHPGPLMDGEILLVGVIGKYEYRNYVKNIGHNEKIEYHCKKMYRLMGPSGATCVHGKNKHGQVVAEWSPPEKPYCELGKHPLFSMVLRGRRSVANGIWGPNEQRKKMRRRDRVRRNSAV